MSRSVLVVGASRGIGAAIASRFAAAGDRVAGTHRGTGVPDGVHAVLCDVTAPQDALRAATEAAEANGPVEVMVYNAGLTRDGLVVRMSDDDFAAVYEATVAGAFRFARAVLKPMMRARAGSLVFISSVSSRVGVRGQGNYTAAKAGLDGLSRTLAHEYAPYGIRSNTLAPGPVETDMTAQLDDNQRKAMLTEVPLGRFGTAAEIADATYWLAGASFVTGITLPVAGGAGMGL